MSAAPQSTAAGSSNSGLARTLVQQSLLRQQRADELTRRAAQNNSQFLDELFRDGATDGLEPLQVARVASEAFGHALLDLDAVDDAFIPPDLLDKKLTAAIRVLALSRRGNRIVVATSDPSNLAALDKIKFQTQLTPQVVVVEHDKLARRLQVATQSAVQQLEALVGNDFDMDDLLTEQEPTTRAPEPAASDLDDAPVVRFLQKLLLDAVSEGASDLHFEPYEKTYRVRFRVDGALREVAQPPLSIRERLVARIKVVSKLNISEKRVPQDGRLKISIGPQRAIDFRVSTLPTLYGEKIVMRVLDSAQARVGVESLGFEPDQKERVLHAIRQPWGMVLVTGPTGSGKTVSLYSFLSILNEASVNISTAEDPVEIQLAGINQVNINEKVGLTFANALRAFLRQDPDVVMVGEIRDLETADIAVKAAQTGHLVLSTLHTNDAPTSVTRLVNMGVPGYNIVSSLILVVAQRLARRLCTCKQPVDASREVLRAAGFADAELTGAWRPFKPIGCDRCKSTGYKGRVGIFEVMPITAPIQELILAGAGSIQITRQARADGVASLRQSGLVKVQQGVTSLEEVIACTSE